MKREVLEKIAADQERLVKEAFVGVAARLGSGLLRAGKAAVKNPMATGSAALTGMTAVDDVAGGAQRVAGRPQVATMPQSPVTY